MTDFSQRKWKAWMVVDRHGKPAGSCAADSIETTKGYAEEERVAHATYHGNSKRCPFRVIRVEIQELRK